jgi:hypothetical protein
LTRRHLPALAWVAAAYAALAALNLLTPAYTECVSDSWCLSSRADWWLLALLQLALLLLGLAAAGLALIWAFRMLASPRRHVWFLLFFVVLGASGTLVWFATVPRAQWGAFVHVPIAGVLCIGLGVLMYFGFRPRPRRPRRVKLS